MYFSSRNYYMLTSLKNTAIFCSKMLSSTRLSLETTNSHYMPTRIAQYLKSNGSQNNKQHNYKINQEKKNLRIMDTK